MKPRLTFLLKITLTLRSLRTTCSKSYTLSNLIYCRYKFVLLYWVPACVLCYISEKWWLIRTSLQRGSLSFLLQTEQAFVSPLLSDCSSMHSLMDYCSPAAPVISEGDVMPCCLFVLLREHRDLVCAVSSVA